MYAEWRRCFEKVCIDVVGRNTKFVSKKVKRLPSAFKRLLELRNIVRKEAELSGSKDLFDIAMKMSDKIKTLVSARHKRQWENFCAEVKSKELGPREFYVLLKRVIGSQRGETGGIRNLQGEIVSNGNEVRHIWRDFFISLGKDESEGLFDDVFMKEVEEKVREIEKKSYDVFVEGLDEVISEREILFHLKKLGNFKAAGVDGIKNELLKLCAGNEGTRVLYSLLNYIWESEILPQELTIGRIVTLFKGGDPFDPGDYRGITLLSVVYKLLSSIVNTRLSIFCEKNGVLAEEQGGFRQGRGCADQIYSLYSIVEDRRRQKQSTFLCFIDIKKAYDRVWRDGLWLRMAECGINGKIWRVVRSFYASTKSSVSVGGKDSDFFDTDLGVRQGDVLSPLVFSIFFNGLIELLRCKGFGITVIGRKICGLWYADDIVLLAESADELQAMLSCVDDYCFKWRCSANAKKSGVMVVGGAPENLPIFSLNGEQVPIVFRYKYLGVLFNNDWNWHDHIDYILLRTEKAVKSLEWRLWKNRAVDIETKVIAWKTIFRPGLEYGSEVWWPHVKEIERFERLQLKVCKWMLACAVTTPSEVVRGDLGVPTMQSRFLRARLSWAGTVKSMRKERIAGICSELSTEWSKRVARAVYLVNLEDEFESLLPKESVETRKEMIESWKCLVKAQVMSREFEKWQSALILSKKAQIYLKIKAEPGLEPFLSLSEFSRGGSLRFKLRSGMLYLNDEVGRRAKGSSADKRFCCICDMSVVENAEHFLFVCPALDNIREIFSSRLNCLCEKFGLNTFFVKWASGSLDSRFMIVLGDCTKAISDELDRSMKPKDAAYQIRRIANHFILSLWNARKKILHSDPVYAGGAIDPLCGSAS